MRWILTSVVVLVCMSQLGGAENQLPSMPREESQDNNLNYSGRTEPSPDEALSNISSEFYLAIIQDLWPKINSFLSGVIAQWEKEQVLADAEASALQQDDTLEAFDFIIVGGGSAGSVVANRLSKYYKVLLLERGGEQNPITKLPLAALFNPGHPGLDYTYYSVPQETSCQSSYNKSQVLRGSRSLGGSSNLNFMIYLRGHVKDYENWARITGDERWSYDQVRPFFLSTSDMGEPGSDFSSRAQEGKLHVQNSSFNPMVKEFLEATQWAGIKSLDLNEPYNDTGAQPNPLSTVRGQRCSTYTAFIEPVRNRTNLIIHKHATVYKVLFRGDNNQAYGVEYERHGKVHIARASKEVILSAGALETPKLLMLSGVGPRERLRAVGIETLVDLPVGKNLQDHVSTMLGPFSINESKAFVPERDLRPEDVEEFVTNGTGKLTQTGVNAHAFFTSSRAVSEGEGSWADTQLMYNGLAGASIFPDFFSNVWNVDKDVMEDFYAGFAGRDSFLLIVLAARPKQRGELWLKSRNYRDDPVVDPMYYRDNSTGDMEVMLEGIKRSLDLAENAPSLKRLGSKLSPRPVKPCRHVPFRTDEYWECVVRHLCPSYFHYCGTTAMGRAGSGSAVVDSELRVFGTTGLRVVDAGVMPTIPTSNINAVVVMIGDRASSFILDEYGRGG